MNKDDLIAHRNRILHRRRSGIKLNNEEKLWLATTPAYNDILNYSLLSQDIIDIEANKKYHINVRLLSSTTRNEITPTFSIPLKKGNIIYNGLLEDLYGHISKDKRIYILSTNNSVSHPDCEFDIISYLGKLAISLNCVMYDHRGISYLGSSNMHKIGFLRNEISENKIVYSCCDLDSTIPDKYSFLVEWHRCDK